MKTVFLIVVLVLAAALLALIVWRQLDHRADQARMDELLSLQPPSPDHFDPAMVANLPDPARRYFEYTIAPGTALYTTVDIEMQGLFSLGTKDRPDYLPMTARQVLAAPDGFVWKMTAGTGMMQVTGSDSDCWTRFWVAGLIPVARAGSTADHRRSSFGRYISEAVFFTPAAMLPGPNVTWHAVDDTTSMVTVRHNGLLQEVFITVTPAGQPVEVSFMRWSNANPDKLFRLQPFGGYLSDFQDFDGFLLPTHVEAGNFFGTDAYFPFFIADITNLSFPGAT